MAARISHAIKNTMTMSITWAKALVLYQGTPLPPMFFSPGAIWAGAGTGAGNGAGAGVKKGGGGKEVPGLPTAFPRSKVVLTPPRFM
jgi:hypothetical protein